ncbi:MAG TPA: DEAD/DEAH box helicase, partial [Geobacterales bacterium]|nr:DEAD/DEAH box helicase [Geobacterales bacterium]
MLRYFSSHAISQLRQAIAEAAGNEVFFLGKTDALRQVIEVEPLARGSRDAVPAILVTVSFGDVVIHNHPSGELTPSVADLEIASLVGNQGVGFSIIDNAVERCYQVVAPFEQRQTTPISHPELETVFKEQGVLARTLTGYEYRQEQLRMAFNVADAFNGNQVAMVEAGTGTGKSLAYLVPAIYWAVRNQERVVISTNTINLQEQLIKKDIPFLRQQLGVEFRAILVKGRSNYLCLRKLAAATAEPTLFGDDLQQELETIRAWSGTTSDGCRSDLSFVPQDEVWQELSCEADQCNRVKCPFYGRCFFYRARREASTADILVVNHALLMTDVALRRQTGNSTAAVLPPFQRLICDEAHHLEGVATNFLAGQVSRQGLLHVIGRLQHPRKQQMGVLPRLSTQLSREVPEEF